jgi:hypothetical protein
MEPLPFPKAKRLVEHGEVVSGDLFADPLAMPRDEEGCETSFEQPIPLICISHESEGSALRDRDQPGLAWQRPRESTICASPLPSAPC